MNHFIKYCKECNKVIAQCRCPKENKEIQYGICSECKAKKESNGKTNAV